MPDEGVHVRWSFAVVAVATAVLLVLPFVARGGGVRLEDRHSDPTPAVEIATVAVTQAGKLYHDPRCRFIHGSPILEPTGVAVSRGLSPCPRCLGPLRAAVESRAVAPALD